MNLLDIYIIEPTKPLTCTKALNDWIRLFNASSMEELDLIRTKNKGVQEAMAVVRTMRLERSLRWMYEEHLKETRDRWAREEYVMDLGRKEGIVEGMTKGREDRSLRICTM